MRYVWVLLALVVGYVILSYAASAQTTKECTAQSTGLKYVHVPGSGIASLFFVIPLVALAPLAYPLATNNQYRCHLVVIGSDAAGVFQNAKPKWSN